MPRTARKKSKSGIYHLILRGINRQTIFEDEEDSHRFLHTLEVFQKKSEFILYAYCLMGNHIQLLIKEGDPGGRVIQGDVPRGSLLKGPEFNYLSIHGDELPWIVFFQSNYSEIKGISGKNAEFNITAKMPAVVRHSRPGL